MTSKYIYTSLHKYTSLKTRRIYAYALKTGARSGTEDLDKQMMIYEFLFL